MTTTPRNNQARKECATIHRAKHRLEYLRRQIKAERISQGELCELESLVEFIEPGDVDLLEPAGVPEALAHAPAVTWVMHQELKAALYLIEQLHQAFYRKDLPTTTTAIRPIMSLTRPRIEGIRKVLQEVEGT